MTNIDRTTQTEEQMNRYEEICIQLLDAIDSKIAKLNRKFENDQIVEEDWEEDVALLEAEARGIRATMSEYLRVFRGRK
jgi:hypothetical protein